jgi:hypothetical protein
LNGQEDNVAPQDVLISYTSVNKTLPLVLSDLVSVSGVNIIYSENKLNKKRKIKIQAKEQKLGVVLRNVLKPYRLDYEVIGENIVIISIKSDEYKQNLILSGYIKDSDSGEPLPYATIVDSKTGIGTISNENGFYSISLLRKEYEFIVSYIGYNSQTVTKFLSENLTKDIALSIDNTLNEIIVTDQFYKETSADIGRDRFDKSTINHATFLGGEADINRVIGMSAGVSSGADGFGGLNVRGGSYDQNLILYDGAPMHHTGHAMGLLSIFNSATIQEATLYKSGFPAKYGGKLSSIVDIRTRDGNYNKVSGEIGLSTLASKISIEGPLIKDKASFLFSYRRTFADVWVKALSKYQYDISGDTGEASYGFQDINAKINFKLNKNNKFSVTYYTGDDNFKNFSNSEKSVEESTFIDKKRNNVSWGSQLISVQLQSSLSNRVFTRLIGYNSSWNFDNYNYNSYYIDRDTATAEIYNASLEESEINVLGGRFELDFLASRKYTLKTGIIFNKQKLTPFAQHQNNLKDGKIFPDILTSEDLSKLGNKVSYSNTEISHYVQNEFRLGSNALLTLGLHSSSLESEGTRHISLQPRFGIQIDSKNSAARFTVSRMTQYNQVISDNQLGFPSDLWVSTTNRLKPANSWQAALGGTININKSFDIGAEFYYKELDNIISLAEGGLIPFGSETMEWENSIPRGTGTAYGVELSAIKRFGKININMNYTFSKSNRDFEDLNNGMVFEFRYDRTHMFNFNMRRSLGKTVDVNLNLIYGKGNPVTLPTSEILELTNLDGEKFLSIVYTEKNNVRIKDYLRLDIGFNFYTKYKFGHQKFFIGVYNLMNNANPLYFDIKRNKFDSNVYEVNKISVLPILPALNYSLTF